MCSFEKNIYENIHNKSFNTYSLKNGMYIFQKQMLFTHQLCEQMEDLAYFTFKSSHYLMENLILSVHSAIF